MTSTPPGAQRGAVIAGHARPPTLAVAAVLRCSRQTAGPGRLAAGTQTPFACVRRFVKDGEMKTEYPVIIGGENFGCGSSREHAPVALGASGARVLAPSRAWRVGQRLGCRLQQRRPETGFSRTWDCLWASGLPGSPSALAALRPLCRRTAAGSQVVVAQSYARIFFRNCISTGELYPVETDVRLCDELATGQDVTVDMERDVLINHTTGKEYSLKPIGEVRGVVGAVAGRVQRASVRAGRSRSGSWRSVLVAGRCLRGVSHHERLACDCRGPLPCPSPQQNARRHCAGWPRDRCWWHL